MPSDESFASFVSTLGRRLTGHWLYLSLGLGVFFWFFSAFLYTSVFQHGADRPLIREITSGSPHMLFVRGFVLLLFLGFGLYAQLMDGRQKEINQFLREKEKAIEKEKRFSDTLINSLPGVFYLFDKDLKFHRWNCNLQEVTGYSGEELQERSPLDLFDEKESPIVADRIGQIFSSGASRVEACFLSRNGLKTPYYLTGHTIRIDHADYVIGVGIDLTEKKRMESEREEIFKRLQESEERFRRLAENAKDMIYRMSLPDGAYEYVSPAAEAIFGYAPEVFYHSPPLIRDLIHPDWKATFQELFENMVTGEVSTSYEYPIISPEGDVRWVNQRNVLVRDEDGTPAAIEGMVTDVTEQKTAEILLAGEREQLKALFDSTDDIIYVADPDTHELLFVNRAVRETWGDEAVGKMCHEVLQDRSSPCPFCTNPLIFDEHLGDTHVWEFQNEIDHHWYRCADKAIRWSDGRWVRYEIATDITEEKIFRQEQVRLEKFSVLGQVAAGMAHELNNPLMGVLNFSQYCIDETGEEDDRYPVLQDIERETRRCIDIVGMFLSAARQDDLFLGTIEPFDPGRVISNALKLLTYRIEKGGVRVSLECPESIPNLLMSRDAFQQVFVNLLSNALDAVEHQVKKEIRVQLEQHSGQLLISVTDTGYGMSAEAREKIFDPFFTTKPPGKGTGLGLSTCWNIVTSHQGQIECRSREGLGTEMIVTFPIHEPSDSSFREAECEKENPDRG